LNEEVKATKDLEKSPTAPSPLSAIDPVVFQRQLTILVLSLVLFWLVVEILQKFASVLQPFFVACLIAYMIIPLHVRLVRWRVPSPLAYVVILSLTLALLFTLGQYVYSSLTGRSAEQWQRYQQGVDALVQRVAASLPFEVPWAENFKLRDFLASETRLNALIRQSLQTAVSELFGLLTTCFVIFVYLIFLIAEQASLPGRIRRAFDVAKADQVLAVVANINQAIAQYIGLKTFVSFLQGFLSLLVLALFGVDFAVMWGLLIFLFNFIPYIGSLIAVAAPIVLSFVQYPDQPWRGIVVTILLLLIQRVIDNYIEPRLTGQKLGVSPLLVLLSLAFWGSLWGIVGMILAVPLTVVAKIILENIRETRPIAVLVSSD
jgi:predicted PurR-regulated permease PerM